MGMTVTVAPLKAQDRVCAVERPSWAPPGVDIESPSAARIYDYHLGGVHNFPVDRQVADQIARMAPELPRIMRANRAFLDRAVRFLVAAGIRQFLDLGSGIPTVDNVHEIAQRMAPDARVAYVDNDPVAVAHSRALLGDNPYATAVEADIRNVARVLRAPEVGGLIDFSQPVALLMVAVLHFMPDSDDVDSVIAGYRHAVPGGSYLVISHAPADHDNEPEDARQAQSTYRRRVADFAPRTKAEIAAMFTGFDLVDPGIVHVELWRPEGDATPDPVGGWVGVGHKPTG